MKYKFASCLCGIFMIIINMLYYMYRTLKPYMITVHIRSYGFIKLCLNSHQRNFITGSPQSVIIITKELAAFLKEPGNGSRQV